MYAVAMPVTALVTPGPGGDQRDADLVRRARVAVGGVDGALLVPHQHVLDLVLLEELVVDVEDRAARIAEDVLDAFFLEAADDDFRTRELHGCALSELTWNPARRDVRRGLLQNCLARFADGRAQARLESGRKPRSGNYRRTPGESPRSLVASREGAQTAVFAVQHRPFPADRRNRYPRRPVPVKARCGAQLAGRATCPL